MISEKILQLLKDFYVGSEGRNVFPLDQIGVSWGGISQTVLDSQIDAFHPKAEFF